MIVASTFRRCSLANADRCQRVTQNPVSIFDPVQIERGRPREMSGSQPGPSVPGVSGGSGGTPPHMISRVAHIAKGRSHSAPLSASSPHALGYRYLDGTFLMQ